MADIKVEIEDAQPINVSLGEAVNIYEWWTGDYNDLNNLPDLTLKADKSDTYTKIEVDTSLSGKANTTHNHTLTSLSEKSYNSLTDKPTIPADADDIDDTSTDHKFVTSADITKLSNLSGTNTGDQDLSGLMPKTQTLNAQTGSYTLVVADATKLVTVTVSAAANVTVPANVFSAGQTVEVLDAGAARITFVAGSGMTLNATPSLVSRAQYSGHMIKFLSATSAVVIGDLA